MTADEAAQIQLNGSRLRERVWNAVLLIAKANYVSEANVKRIWDATGIDDVFEEIYKSGYRILLDQGWNPMREVNDDDWTPSPDCIDNPTTRGGIADD